MDGRGSLKLSLKNSSIHPFSDQPSYGHRDEALKNVHRALHKTEFQTAVLRRKIGRLAAVNLICGAGMAGGGERLGASFANRKADAADSD
jgi:hypothetical protein